jgi:SPP1 family predicted phage head-tail adaptor
MPIRAGALRHSVTIRRETRTRNPSGGGYTSAWTDVATVRAEVTGLTGSESVLSQALQGVATFQVRIRWRGDITPADQLRSAGGACFGFDAKGDERYVNIRSAVDPDGRREQLVIIADTSSVRS